MQRLEVSVAVGPIYASLGFKRLITKVMYNSVPKIKFEKSGHLVGFIIRIYHDARSPECETDFLEFLWTASFGFVNS